MDHDARPTPEAWGTTVAQLTEPVVLLRVFALACGMAVVVGSTGPWAEGYAHWDLELTRIPGVWRAEGQLALLAGVIASGTAAWRIGRRSRASATLLLLAFAAAAAVTAPLQADIDRWQTYQGGGPVEGWEWFEPRWGLTLTLVSAVAGGVTTLALLLHTFRPTADDAEGAGEPGNAPLDASIAQRPA